MTPHKHCEVIKAWADGHEIQWRIPGKTRWYDMDEDPGWILGNEYRIKPKTIKYRVALLKNNVGVAYTYTADNQQIDPMLERSKHFVKWITDWVEVEIDEA